MEKVLIIGSATSREYALVRELSVYCKCKVSAYLWRDSHFIKNHCTNYEVGDVQDIDRIIQFTKKVKPDFVIVTQGEAMQVGIRNHLDSINIPCISPTKEQSKLENSKIFCRQFIKEINEHFVPKHKAFDVKNIADLDGYINELKSDKVVLKFDGLMNSEGVKIYNLKKDSKKDLKNQANTWIKKVNGKIVVEEFVEGDEVSIMSFVDGTNIVHMPPVKNYKKIWEGDGGDNTSGMGSITIGKTLGFLTNKDVLKLEEVNNLVFEKIKKDFSEKYIGILMGEFIINNGEIKVIEYNTRFGNPSTINILNLLDTSFLEICKSMISGTLNNTPIKWKNLASVSVSVVPKGYPYSKENVGKKINLTKLEKEELGHIFFASLNVDSNKDITLMNSRNLTVCVVGEEINNCRSRIIKILDKIGGPIYFRKDIGTF